MDMIKCPKCGSKNIAEILYGMPAFSEELLLQEKEGKIVFGGCNIIYGLSESHHCNDCHTDFGVIDDPHFEEK